MYQPRDYRHLIKPKDLVTFEVTVKETDLFIAANKELVSEAAASILKYRNQLEEYIGDNPLFQSTLRPCEVNTDAPRIVHDMALAGAKAKVGPMAAVAGAIAELVGRELLEYSREVIVENGGDIFLKSKRPRRVGVFAGKSPFGHGLALEIRPDETPLGVCTSSGTIGHSRSFGRADATVVVSKSTALADAAATGVCNLIKVKGDIVEGIEYAKGIDGLQGVLIVKDDKLGVWGDLRLVGIDPVRGPSR